MKHPIRRLVAFGGAAAMAAAITVPLASGTATASAKVPAGFNKAVAVKFIRSGDKMRLARGGAHATAIKGVPGYYSYNWSGYAETGGTYSKVSGSWVEPAITCDASDAGYQIAAFWVGIDGDGSSTVEQDGTIEECYQGSYLGAADWWETYPTDSVQVVYGVTTGDHISASVAFAHGVYTMSVKDTTASANSFSQKQYCGLPSTCTNASAEWIGEAPCCNGSYEYDLAKWSPYIKFTAAKVTGSSGSGTISTYAGGADESFLEMLGDQTNAPIADVTATNGAGNEFRDYWYGYN
jgi:hypothetical protein